MADQEEWSTPRPGRAAPAGHLCRPLDGAGGTDEEVLRSVKPRQEPVGGPDGGNHHRSSPPDEEAPAEASIEGRRGEEPPHHDDHRRLSRFAGERSRVASPARPAFHLHHISPWSVATPTHGANANHPSPRGGRRAGRRQRPARRGDRPPRRTSVQAAPAVQVVPPVPPPTRRVGWPGPASDPQDALATGPVGPSTAEDRPPPDQRGG